MLTEAQLAAFERDGAVTVGTPLSAAALDAAECAWDLLVTPVAAVAGVSHPTFHVAGDCDEHEGFRAVVGHPFFASVARQVLRTSGGVRHWSNVHSREPSRLQSPLPHWREVWAGQRQDICGGCHIDVQQTADDFDATPRRECSLSMWLWLTDVTAEGGAMRYLPGSHRLLNEHWRRVLRADQRKYLPRVRSMRPDPHGWCRRAKEQHGQQWPALPHFPEGLAELPGRSRWHDQQPVAAVARRGQLMVWTSGLLHAAHYNATNRPRKAITMACRRTSPS